MPQSKGSSMKALKTKVKLKQRACAKWYNKLMLWVIPRSIMAGELKQTLNYVKRKDWYGQQEQSRVCLQTVDLRGDQGRIKRKVHVFSKI